MASLPLVNTIKPLLGLGAEVAGAVLSHVPGPVGALTRRLRAPQEQAAAPVPPPAPSAPVGSAARRTPGVTTTSRPKAATRRSAAAKAKPAGRVNAEKPAPPIAEATPAELAELGEGRQPAPLGSTSPNGS